MEKFYLEIPTIERKEEAIDYFNEHIKYHSDMNGTGSMDMFLKESTYEQWLKELENKTNQEYMDTLGWAPSLTYFLVRENDNRIIRNKKDNIKINNKAANKMNLTEISYKKRKGYAANISLSHLVWQ